MSGPNTLSTSAWRVTRQHDNTLHAAFQQGVPLCVQAMTGLKALHDVVKFDNNNQFDNTNAAPSMSI